MEVALQQFLRLPRLPLPPLRLELKTRFELGNGLLARHCPNLGQPLPFISPFLTSSHDSANPKLVGTVYPALPFHLDSWYNTLGKTVSIPLLAPIGNLTIKINGTIMDYTCLIS